MSTRKASTHHDQLPQLPAAWPRGGNRVTRWIGRTVLRLAGWRVTGELPERTPLVVAVAPHTSNWDFIVGMAAMLALGLRARWMGKHTIFRWPIRSLLESLGGIPVDRTRPGGVVGQAVAVLRAEPHSILGLAPEGTRSRVDQWKTGFLRIAAEADAPVLPLGIDYATRRVVIGSPYIPTEDLQKDLEEIRAYFRQFTALKPELAG